MKTYSPSGIVPLRGALLTAVGALLAAVVGGFVYAFAFWWIGIGLLRILLMLGFAIALGFTIAALARGGKVRSPLFVTVIALAAVVLTLWIYWGAYDWARHGPDAGLTAWSSAGLTAQAQDLFENGSWAIRRSVIKGWLLVVFWVAEALAIGFIVVAGASADAQRPFCETCLEWSDSTSNLMRLQGTGTEPAFQEVLAGDLTALGLCEPAPHGSREYVRLDLASCPKCEHSSFVSLYAVTVTKDKKGNDKTDQKTLVMNGALTAAQAEFLRLFAEQMRPPPLVAGEAGESVEDEEE